MTVFLESEKMPRTPTEYYETFTNFYDGDFSDYQNNLDSRLENEYNQNINNSNWLNSYTSIRTKWNQLPDIFKIPVHFSQCYYFFKSPYASNNGWSTLIALALSLQRIEPLTSNLDEIENRILNLQFVSSTGSTPQIIETSLKLFWAIDHLRVIIDPENSILVVDDPSVPTVEDMTVAEKLNNAYQTSNIPETVSSMISNLKDSAIKNVLSFGIGGVFALILIIYLLGRKKT